jgi:hypothetical protein
MSTLKKYLLSSGKVREDELWVGWFWVGLIRLG